MRTHHFYGGYPVVALRLGNGLVLGPFYVEGQPSASARPRLLAVRLSPSTRERIHPSLFRVWKSNTSDTANITELTQTKQRRMLTFALPRTESPSIRLRAPNADPRGPPGAPGACRNPLAGRARPGRIIMRGVGE